MMQTFGCYPAEPVLRDTPVAWVPRYAGNRRLWADTGRAGLVNTSQRKPFRIRKMKIALLSDIHGNSLALDAVLDDIEKTGGVNAYWCLGDFVALGPDPVGVLRRLERLQNASFIRGNTDRYVAFGDRPAPTMEEAASDRSLLPALVEVANTFAWTQGMVTAGGWLDWLRCPWSSGTTLLKTPRFFASTRSQVVTMARVSRRNSHQVIWRVG